MANSFEAEEFSFSNMPEDPTTNIQGRHLRNNHNPGPDLSVK